MNSQDETRECQNCRAAIAKLAAYCVHCGHVDESRILRAGSEIVPGVTIVGVSIEADKPTKDSSGA